MSNILYTSHREWNIGLWFHHFNGLGILGTISAKIGGSKYFKTIINYEFEGNIAMILSALVGYIFGVESG